MKKNVKKKNETILIKREIKEFSRYLTTKKNEEAVYFIFSF